jgi:hypothetical protein
MMMSFREVRVSFAHGSSSRWPALPPLRSRIGAGLRSGGGIDEPVLYSSSSCWQPGRRLPVFSFLLHNKKTHRRMDGGSQVDALGEFHLIAALTKLSQSAQRTRFMTGRINQL